MCPQRIAIVLVAPQGDANIGAVARAMKNFGLADLRIVGGVSHVTDAAFMWAVDASDVLEKARRFASLDDALDDMSTAVAFTRRLGKARRTRLPVREAAPWLFQKARAGGVALVFGREDKGLSNDEVRRCDAIVTIPSAAALPSLNLAQAVIIACHEFFAAGRATKPAKRPANGKRQKKATETAPQEAFVSRREVTAVLERLEEMLSALGYGDRPRQLLKSKILHQMERIFGRAGLSGRDVGMWTGLAARVLALLPQEKDTNR